MRVKAPLMLALQRRKQCYRYLKVGGCLMQRRGTCLQGH